jgi:glycosyltransferase involved in cell wall biosynthesis
MPAFHVPAAEPMTILALLEHYLPGYKSGGPLRSVEHMVEQLGEPFTFKIVTRDRDMHDRSGFPGITAGEWHAVGKGRAIYLTPSQLGPLAMRRVIAGTQHDVLYLNSLFSPSFALVPLLLRRLRALAPRPVVLATRGELHPGALSTGSWGRWLPKRLDARLPSPRRIKKHVYIAVTRALRLYGGVTWQASNEVEAGHIRRHMGRRATVVVAPDLAAAPPPARPAAECRKVPGTLRVAYLSRIDPKKNLAGAIALLAGVRGEVSLDIYGPVDDERYWARCRAALDRLPPNVSARYHGPVPHEWVGDVFRTHHLFLFPTWGENYGHVVLEALVQGCPVLVSDRTHWRGLAAHRAGWDVDPDDGEAMRALLQACVDMDEPEYRRWSAGAAAYGRARSTDPRPVRSSRDLFHGASPGGGVAAPAARRG